MFEIGVGIGIYFAIGFITLLAWKALDLDEIRDAPWSQLAVNLVVWPLFMVLALAWRASCLFQTRAAKGHPRHRALF